MHAQTASEDSPPAGARPTNRCCGKPTGFWIVTALVTALLVLHQDNWFWTDDTLVFGFLPIGLFWHGCLSIGASITWLIATNIAWPVDEDRPLPADARDMETP